MINEPAPSAREIAHAVRTGATTATAVVQQALARIDRLNPTLNAIIARDDARALADAAALDHRLTHDELDQNQLPLVGVPLAVKDTEDTIGYRTTFGSRIFADAPIADRDSVLVARLKAAGCIVIGKSNTPEFACSGDTDNLVFGRPATRTPPTASRAAPPVVRQSRSCPAWFRWPPRPTAVAPSGSPDQPAACPASNRHWAGCPTADRTPSTGRWSPPAEYSPGLSTICSALST